MRDEIARYRELWRQVRARRLALKADLTARGLDIAAVRTHRDYRRMKKEQRRLTVLIRQRERTLQRRGAE